MNLPLSYIFPTLTLLSFLACHASDVALFPDGESHDIGELNNSPRGNLRGIMQLRESRSVPSELVIQPSSEDENLHRKLSAASITPSSQKFSFPALPPFLKRGDTVMVLEDRDSSRKMLVKRLQVLGFNVIETVYGYQAYDAACNAATDDIKISLFLFDFDVPFKADEVAVRLSCGQPQLNGGQTARLIKLIEAGVKNPFERSVFVCLTANPNDAKEYADVFWQIRDKFTESNAEDFFQDVRHQLMVSEIASIVVPKVLKQGTTKALSRSATEPNTPDIEAAGN